jgi:hypothetical protein
MADKPRRWCRGKFHYASVELAERSCRALAWKNSLRGRRKKDMRLTPYWCDVCQAFHIGHERVDVPPAHENSPASDDTTDGARSDLQRNQER